MLLRSAEEQLHHLYARRKFDTFPTGRRKWTLPFKAAAQQQPGFFGDTGIAGQFG